MPRAEDYTHLFWAEGFPGHTPGAPWLRVIQTGRFAMVLDTESLTVPHVGALQGSDYATAARADNSAWRKLPPAKLELEISKEGKVYRCAGAAKWSQFGGPRIVDSGRFVQRADVMGLEFKADDGSRLDVEARFETVAWPDRLALILAVRPKSVWTNGALEIRTDAMRNELRQRQELSAGESWGTSVWREVSVVLDEDTGIAPVRWLGKLFAKSGAGAPLVVQASEFSSGQARPVRFDAARGWHVVNLDGIEPIVPVGAGERRNDAVERVKLVLDNPADREQVARLLFEKTAHGIRQRIGSAITGVSAMLRDADGNPTGIPVQLSKNWHNRPEGGVYGGQWFHGFSQVRLPPRAKVELELTIAYGHWGGVAAASHAQLSLVGWGSNQLWDESALGSWGESICYEPDQVQGGCAVLDVRPAMVKSMNKDQSWGWTHNVGGGDFFRLFDATGHRVFPTRMRTAYEKHGPCLTEVTYAGRLGDGIEQAATVCLARTDDIVRGTYRLRMDVTAPVEFSRFVIFQVGADTYSYTGERKMALGSETGLVREWATTWGGATNRTQPVECTGRTPWISLHEAVSRARTNEQGAWANRGIVIRSWSARLGGKAAAPWMVERGVKARGSDTSTADLVPPPGVTRLERGDFVEATFEHIVMPQFLDDYYGPNEALRDALREHANTWRMIHREAECNDRRVVMKTGELERTFPDVRLRADDDAAEFTMEGGIGYVPVTITGLTTPRGFALLVDGKRVDQSVHGKDFWQTDYDAVAKRWSLTFNVKAGGAMQTFRFGWNTALKIPASAPYTGSPSGEPR